MVWSIALSVGYTGDMPTHKFTPTQDLILDVLMARHRLGEGFWTFDSRLKPSLTALMDLGYVFVMDGNVENTVRAGLTNEGRIEFVGTYQSPLERKVEALQDAVKDLVRKNENLRMNAIEGSF